MGKNGWDQKRDGLKQKGVDAMMGVQEITTTILVFAAAILLAVAAILVISRQSKNRKQFSEADAHEKVSRALHRFAGPRKFAVLDDVKLAASGASGWADHILIGHFGVLLVYDMRFEGEYFGSPKDKEWTVMAEGQPKRTVMNPFPAAAQCSGRVITLLKEAGCGMAEVSTAVVLPGSRNHLLIKSDQLIQASQLGGYLRRSKFAQDNGLDPQKAAAVLEGARVG